jgi:choline dehydrogenase-like flavoprotein
VSDFCIIGSGPSAISAAVALTRRNLRVTMLDAGRTLEEARAETVARLGALAPGDWSGADIRSIKEGVSASSEGIPLKRLYGSDFAFRTDGTELSFDYAHAGTRPGFARGGLSNVWGAGMLPFHRDDIADWPIDPGELDEGYRGVLSFVPCSGVRDALDDLFPHHCASLQTLPPGRQGQSFLSDAARSAEALARRGIVAGQSRLAVDAKACVRCGMCLYGCPYQLIYNSAFTLTQLRTLPHFRYEPGFVAERLREEKGSVRIDGHDLTTGARRQCEAGRVFLGAGVIPSTAILLSSLGDFNVRIRLQDSFYFLLPMLRLAGVPDPGGENLHTLAQAFLVMRDPKVCEALVHFSIYGYNDLMIPSLKASIGPPGGIGALVSRVLVAGGYLHSKLSPGLWMTLNPGRIRLEGEDSTSAIAVARKAAMNLLRQAARLRTVPLIPGMRFPVPGRGFHSGGSFPMSRESLRHTSDVEGRPYGFDRVHLVDASCLPSIPATPPTLPVMANAWRIANRAADRA